MGPYLGDFEEDALIYFCWDTNNKSGASITRATNGTIKVYKDDGTSESTAGVVDTEDFDGLTGIHNCKIDSSADAFYTPGHDYSVVLAGAVIDGETVNACLKTDSRQANFSAKQRKCWSIKPCRTKLPAQSVIMMMTARRFF